ncbi:hypothetical protein V6R21_05745 [Limibacter armeniacum]|uniref:hypothetical protein n=1 Tax=Limibacter armeniacum TaxID=466084 RepID=UPI002FE64D2F
MEKVYYWFIEWLTSPVTDYMTDLRVMFIVTVVMGVPSWLDIRALKKRIAKSNKELEDEKRGRKK